MTKRNGLGNPNALANRILDLRAGTTANFFPDATVVVGGMPMTTREIYLRLRSVEALREAVTNARVTLGNALTAYQASLPGIKLFIKNYEAALKAQFGVDSPKLRDFGITPPRPRQRTSLEKHLAATRAQQTRAANKQAAESRPVAAPGEATLVLVGPGAGGGTTEGE